MLVNRCMTLTLHGWGLKYVNYSSPAAVWVKPFQLRLIFCQAVQPCCRQTSPAQGAVEWKEPHPFLHRRGSMVAAYPRCASAVQQQQQEKKKTWLSHTYIHTSTWNLLHAYNFLCKKQKKQNMPDTFFIWGFSLINASEMRGKDFPHVKKASVWVLTSFPTSQLNNRSWMNVFCGVHVSHR